MTRTLFPDRIETDRIVFERCSHDTVDPFEFYEFVTHDDWQNEATEHMPWFRLQRLDQVVDFIDRAEQQWEDREGARYLLRSKVEDHEIIGTTAYGPEWEKPVNPVTTCQREKNTGGQGEHGAAVSSPAQLVTGRQARRPYPSEPLRAHLPRQSHGLHDP